MKAKSVNNNLVGRKVLIDWPVRWQGAKPESQEVLKAASKEKDHYWGETGEIVAVTAPDDRGQTLTVLLDNTKEIIHLYDGAVTVTTVSPGEEDHKEVVDLLRQILDAIKLNNNHR